MSVNTADAATLQQPVKVPSTWKIIWREILNDKLALVSLIIFVGLVLAAYIGAAVLDNDLVVRLNLPLRNAPPGPGLPLGADHGGRSMVHMLFVASRNTFNIAFSMTVISLSFGISMGLISGYFGGHVDNVTMRIVDFFQMVPFLMVVIVLLVIFPGYNIFHFILIMSAFAWPGPLRLVRTRTLQQGRMDYVSASKTLGTRNFVIIFREVLPNIISLLVLQFTLSLAANIGAETGLAFLGFGVPHTSPTLGRLLSVAGAIPNLENRPWQWLPPALLILLMMLCINFVGQALNRVADARRRRV